MGHWVFSAPPAQRPVRELSVNKSHPNTAYLISYCREQLFGLPLQVIQNFPQGPQVLLQKGTFITGVWEI